MVASLLFLAVGWYLGSQTELRKQQAAKMTAEDIRVNSEREAEAIKNERLTQAQQEIQCLKSEVEREKAELETKSAAEKVNFESRKNALDTKEQQLSGREQRLAENEQHLNGKDERLEKLREELDRRSLEITQSENSIRSTLEKVADLTTAEARKELFAKVERENQLQLEKKLRQAEHIAREEADKKARRIITLAIQKCASEQVVEDAITVVNLPAEEMKGRIIGREGRNIRKLEELTGTDLIIDDTPEAVVISCYDPLRREVARLTLEKLIQDGRIHPTKIEEVVESCRRELDERLVQEGESTALQAGVAGLNPELIKALGRLRFRTSYGQNMLSHSLEVSLLAGSMAAELGADMVVAARAGLLHDLGKGLTSEEGPHAATGGRLCSKYGEIPAVVHCVEAHHEDVEQTTVEAVLVQAADAISAARPGARRENVETYFKRLKQLEAVAQNFDCVEQAFAIQAGRELRIFVRPEKVNDAEAESLTIQVAKSIHDNVDYPGNIKVTVIRETRFQTLAS